MKRLLKSKNISNILREKSSITLYTILHITVLENLKVWAQFFVDKIVISQQLDEPDKYGKTPLHLAAERKLPFFVELFLSGGAHVNARDDDGNTPLHILAEASIDCHVYDHDNLKRCCTLLLNHPDVDVTALNLEEQTPFDMISNLTGSNCSISFSKLLERSNSNSERRPKTWVSRLFDAVLLKDQEKLQESYDEYNKRFDSNNNGQSPYASGKKFIYYLGSKRLLYSIIQTRGFDGKLVQDILMLCDDPFAEDFDSKLALHAALERGEPEIVRKLLEKMRNLEKSKKLDLRRYSFSLLQKSLLEAEANKSIECLKILLNSDTNIDVNGSDGYRGLTPLSIAKETGNKRAIQLLEDKGAKQEDATGRQGNKYFDMFTF